MTGSLLSLTTKMNSGGDEGIRTLDTSFGPYAPLAGECLRPLGHISMLLITQITAECMMISFHSPSVNGALAILKGSFLFCIEFVSGLLFGSKESLSCFGLFGYFHPFFSFWFELFIANAEFGSSISHHVTQLLDGEITDFLHANEQRRAYG